MSTLQSLAITEATTINCQLPLCTTYNLHNHQTLHNVLLFEFDEFAAQCSGDQSIRFQGVKGHIHDGRPVVTVGHVTMIRYGFGAAAHQTSHVSATWFPQVVQVYRAVIGSTRKVPLKKIVNDTKK